MGKGITESIFDNAQVIIPMADVQHIEYQKHPTIGENGIFVITSKTHWDMQADTWANAIYIPKEKQQAFISAWCRYRAELEQQNLLQCQD